MMDMPVLGRGAGRGHQGHRAGPPGCRRATSARSPTTATARWASTPLPCPVDVAIACWPWGAYLGDEGVEQGRAHEDLVVDAPRPQRHAAGGQDHRQLRQLLAGQGRGAQGRLRRGHHAQPAGLRERVHRREHLRACATARIITPPRRAGRPRGHHPGLGDDDRPRPRLSRSAIGNLARSDLYIADEVFLSRHRGRGRARSTRSTTAPIPCPGPITTADPGRRTRQGRAGRGRPVQGLGRACRR